MRLLFLALFLLGASRASGDDTDKISSPLIPDLLRTDIYFQKLNDNPTAILVLCPGCNGNGQDWIRNPTWQEFAKSHNLDLAGISFASEVPLLENGRGYYYASQGSGQLLLDGVKREYGRDIPLVLFGFSGGAHFTSRFAEWSPNSVLTWCAYSAGWWDKPKALSNSPPGLIVCGEKDERLAPSLIYFKEGRAIGKPWLWLCAPETGHSIFPPAELFIKKYFDAVLKANVSSHNGEWVDIASEDVATNTVVMTYPSVTGWLPDSSIYDDWKEVHRP